MHYALITQTYQKPFVYTSMSFIHDLFYPEKILFYTDYISFPLRCFQISVYWAEFYISTWQGSNSLQNPSLSMGNIFISNHIYLPQIMKTYD